MLASIRDISERKLKDKELKEAMDELIRSNMELERFAYVSSHDLQEPYVWLPFIHNYWRDVIKIV